MLVYLIFLMPFLNMEQTENCYDLITLRLNREFKLTKDASKDNIYEIECHEPKQIFYKGVYPDKKNFFINCNENSIFDNENLKNYEAIRFSCQERFLKVNLHYYYLARIF